MAQSLKERAGGQPGGPSVAAERTRLRATPPGAEQVPPRPCRSLCPGGSVGALVLLLVLAFGVRTASAQTAVCPDPPGTAPGTGQRIECIEDAMSTSDIDIDLEAGVNITTSGESDHAFHGFHEGTGDIIIRIQGVTDNNTITTSGNLSNGVFGRHEGKGGVDITVTDVDITTTGAGTEGRNAMGVSGELIIGGDHSPYDGNYNAEINVSGSKISTMGSAGYGINGIFESAANEVIPTGNLEITASNTEIITMGHYARGINALTFKTVGDLIITMTGGSITTAGPQAAGIVAAHGNPHSTGQSGDVIIHTTDADITTTWDGSDGAQADAHGIWAVNRTDGEGHITITLIDTNVHTTGPTINAVRGHREGKGDINLNIQGGEITTNHHSASAIYGLHESFMGNIDIDLRDVIIKANGEQLNQQYDDTFSQGVSAYHKGDGDILIDAHAGTAISTKGVDSRGIRGRLNGTGNIKVTAHEGSSVTTIGKNSHGIEVFGPSIAVTVGGTVDASGEGAQGVRVGRLVSGAPDRVAAIGKYGYRKQTVTVNGSVMGNDAGVWLAGGGQVVIGPRGTIGAKSGIAILATGTVPAPDPNPDDVAAILPKLRVDLNLGGYAEGGTGP